MKLLFALALAVSLRADQITYTSTASDTSTAVGNHVDFDAVLSVPKFDPTLGTLNAVRFDYRPFGYLQWDILTKVQGFSEFATYGTSTLLGFTAHEVPPSNLIGFQGSCGDASADLPVCYGALFREDIVYSSTLAIKAELNNGSYFFASGYAMYPSFPLSESYPSSPGDLGDFIGTGNILLPTTTSIDGRIIYASYTGGMAASQQASWTLTTTYLYSPAEISESVATPEPRWGAALFAVLLCLGLGLRARNRAASTVTLPV